MSDEAHVQPEQPQPRGITRITVQGFKSLRDETSIEIRPLTILAGANSSGKSSIMQPLLLMKQTLEAPYDPGALLLNGPIVRYSQSEQMFHSSLHKKSRFLKFSFGLSVNGGRSINVTFKKTPSLPVELAAITYLVPKKGALVKRKLQPEMSDTAVMGIVRDMIPPPLREITSELIKRGGKWKVAVERSFITVRLEVQDEDGTTGSRFSMDPGSAVFAEAIQRVLYVPGFRGNPERTYQLIELGSADPHIFYTFSGRLDNYVASIVHWWGLNKSGKKLAALCTGLQNLGLTKVVNTEKINDVAVEVRVGRMPTSYKGDDQSTVSIADVGLGVSQVLPVVVALLIAKPGQLVYIEQPELHLHPRAQAAMAGLLADAAKRGVRVVIETHSDTLLLAIRKLVTQHANDRDEGKPVDERRGLAADLVKLHWFSRNQEGVTEVRSADLDDDGAFGDWPEDFAETEFDLRVDYLNEVNRRQELLDAQRRATNGSNTNGGGANHNTSSNGHSEDAQQETVETGMEAAD